MEVVRVDAGGHDRDDIDLIPRDLPTRSPRMLVVTTIVGRSSAPVDGDAPSEPQAGAATTSEPTMTIDARRRNQNMSGIPRRE